MAARLLGKMTPMPRRTRPEPALPGALETAVNAFGTRGHLAILLCLADRSPATKPQIIAEVDMAPMTVHHHLLALEKMGLVTVDLPAGARQGRTPRYSLNRTQTAKAIEDLRAALLGDNDRDHHAHG